MLTRDFAARNDEIIKYDGGRRKEGIVAWVNRHSVTNAKEVLCSDLT